MSRGAYDIKHANMKTIAISIEEPTLRELDRLVSRGEPGGKSRSAVVRRAVREFLERHRTREQEARERRILAAHRERLAREAAALVAEQAKP